MCNVNARLRVGRGDLTRRSMHTATPRLAVGSGEGGAAGVPNGASRVTVVT